MISPHPQIRVLVRHLSAPKPGCWMALLHALMANVMHAEICQEGARR